MASRVRLQVLRGHLSVSATENQNMVALTSAVPPFKRLLIANRGEIACRVHRAAKSLGMETVGIYTEEDANGLHCKVLDKAIRLPSGATPVAPYLDAETISAIGAKEGCCAVHPGYGFLSENAEFAAMCEEKGMKFVGPRSETIALFGDKTKAKEQASKAGLPTLESSPGMVSAEDAVAFLKAKPMTFPLLLKASYGGGGRGQAVVQKPVDLAKAFSKCSKEAEMSFGRSEVFIERFLEKAAHIEVQVMGDGQGCVHLFERDCSVQLRKQKVVEIAPARAMSPVLRERICSAAVTLCQSCGYHNAGTVEFLVEGDQTDARARFYFLELNPRIQVEHTITEEITGIDLVSSQLRIAGGETLMALGLEQSKINFQGFAIQVRVGLLPGGGGKLVEYREPDGVRVETSVGAGTVAVTDYDPMIAKLIVKGSTFRDTLKAAHKALADYVVDGVKINRDFLNSILEHEDLKGDVYTTWVEDNKLHVPKQRVFSVDSVGAGTVFVVESPFPGQVTEIKVKPGDVVEAGAVLVVVSAMKMLNDIVSDRPGKVLEVLANLTAQVHDGDGLVRIEATGAAPRADDGPALPQSIRTTTSHGEVASRTLSSVWFTNSKPEEEFYATPIIRSKAKPGEFAYQKRMEHNTGLCAELQRREDLVRQGGPERSRQLHRGRGKNLVRERIYKIVDKGTEFMELSTLAGWEMYGGGIHSGGVVIGIGIVCGREVMFIGTDATIKGGVSFPVGYKKWLRAQSIAELNMLPCVYLMDGGGAKLDSQAGGGGRGKSGRDTSFEGALPAAFVDGGRQFFNQARMSALGVPQIAVVCGMCTAGGAYTPAMCDETIIVKDNGTVYLGGPPLVKAATGEDADEQSLGGAVMHTTKSGTCDHFAPDEDTALAMAREVIENLGGKPRTKLEGMTVPEPPAYDKDSILGVIPESTNIPFDIREVIARITDGSRFHEFKARYGPTMVCGWANIEGYPVGILGNNGMLFSESAIKATHFIQICGKRGTPLVFLHNITGFIIGTTYEQGGITKDGAKMINAVSNVPVPKFSVVCGGSFGAGNYAMCGPAFDPRFTFLWPGARISVMGGEQAAGVVAIIRQNGLKRDGKQQMSAEEEAALKKPITDAIERSNSAWHSSAGVYDDGVIDPRETRSVLAKAISISLNAPFPTTPYGVFRM